MFIFSNGLKPQTDMWAVDEKTSGMSFEICSITSGQNLNLRRLKNKIRWDVSISWRKISLCL